MLRSSFVALFCLALATTSYANPIASQISLETDGTVHTMDSWDYADCGFESDIVQIDSIRVSPDPPKPGQDLTVIVKGTAVGVIKEGAYADVTVKLGLIKLVQKRFDLCEEARNINATVQCPVEKGTYTVEQTVKLPKEIPQAKFTVAVRGYTVEDEDMLCLDLMVNFMKKPFYKLGW